MYGVLSDYLYTEIIFAGLAERRANLAPILSLENAHKEIIHAT